MSDIVLRNVPASFSLVNRKETYSIDLVVSLLKDKIETKQPVTIDDIRNIHAQYSMKREMHRAGWMWASDNGEKKWRRAKTKQEWIDNWSNQWRAIAWFKNNLGSAILKGKLLVIPVIDITPNQINNHE